MNKMNILKALENADGNYILALEDVVDGYNLTDTMAKIGRTRFNVLRNKNGYTLYEKDEEILSFPPFYSHDYMAKVILTAMKY